MPPETESLPEIITFGCRLNANESEQMRALAEAAGLKEVVLLNSCAVTGEAVRQVAQAARSQRRRRPNARIIVTGCAAQIDPGRFAAMPEVDHVFGNAEKLNEKTYLDLAVDGLEQVRVNDIMSVRQTAGHLFDGFRARVRAYVQVQNGCDHRCTFCIIPFGRGPSRSVPAGDVIRQINRLVENGYKEVVLCGVDLTSYGDDLPGQSSLGRLVLQILKHVPDLKRLRLSSIDQVEVDPHLLDAIANEGRLMPHLHLSMQAGDDMILKRMKRRHLSRDAVAFCRQARSLRPDIVFGADLIAGFPTETDVMFQHTLDLIEACDLTFLHVFPFSPRPGTPAARMPQVDRQVIKARAQMLREKGTARRDYYLAEQIGIKTELLMEREDIGRTPQYAEVRTMQKLKPGTLTSATIGGVDGSLLLSDGPE
ncbi:MAG: tRNA (N(6)-L-threonylcarbamoyladenosine(37)-C(2))-methylthiotransferase MtaB [Hyphomicrobiaceae bacterium]